MLTFIDYFGVQMVIFIMAIAELIAVGWIYGVKRLCKDIEFMLGVKTGWYWRICWAIITPGLMIIILIYQFATLTPVEYNGYTYPTYIYGNGFFFFFFII